jgi:hypothetical protein
MCSARPASRGDVTVVAVSPDTFLVRKELGHLRRALIGAGMSKSLATRITRSAPSLAGPTGLLLDDLLERASSEERRRKLTGALCDALGFVFERGRPRARRTPEMPKRRVGRPRSVACCSGPTRGIGTTMGEWPSGACVSADGRYCYTIWRRRAVGERTALFVLLNPPAADPLYDDRVVQSCVKIARGVGLGAEIVSLFPLRGPTEALVARRAELLGDVELAEEHIRQGARRAHLVVLAFGDLKGPLRPLRAQVERLRVVLEQERCAGHIAGLHAVRLTKSGSPAQPVPGAGPPVPYTSWPRWLVPVEDAPGDVRAVIGP